MKKNNLILILLSVVVLLLIGTTIFFVQRNKQKDAEMAEIVEMMNFEKEQLEKDYSDLALEYDTYSSTIRNDSLVQLLQNEKIKVQQLLQELRITKATNAKRIAELKKELATLRTVMAQYVHQIDSLSAANKVLRVENVEVKRKYEAANETVKQLSKEKENLTEVVTRASMLDISDFSMITLDSRNRKTSRYSKINTLQFNYTIQKNITCPPGMKTLYLRLTRPDGEVMTKNPDDVFLYENRYIAYSAKKDFEYAGETLSDVIYWKVDEILQIGTYRADFFVDGFRIGSFTFEIKK
ncbi:MAG TPA: hypothetical protein PK903_04250 [Paludibacteraceae bacterium]|jgi:hypothetical protein|nr:hypothetical protein [Paludibacteraceae bacterium]MDS1032914.1 hypothetical protein [Porphyromonadaceae sp. NP-X]NLJ20605.1 hypothetical protein [Bacteroidales bacterium]MBP9017860.1 hypothetical protein [Paludibacteraceae bacterium]HNZ61340.1 hypothetical protein [Paludibacteraceae bacterium]